MANNFKKFSLFFAIFFIVCTECGYAANLALFSPEEQQWLKDHPTLTMVVSNGPRPIAIWTGPPARNGSSYGPTSQRPAGAPPPMSGMPGSDMPPATGFPPPPFDQQRRGQFGASLYKVPDGEQHYFQGISADYLKAVADLTGIVFKTEWYSGNNVRGALRALNSGKVDLMPAIVDGLHRAISFHISAPYFQTPIVVVMRSDAAPLHDFSQLDSMKVAGLFSLPPRLQALGWKTRIQFVNPPEGLRGVATGRFDAFLGEQALIADELKIGSVNNLKIAGKLPGPSGFCIGVSNRAAKFIPIFDKAIAAISKAKKEAIQRKWLGGPDLFHPASNKMAGTAPKGQTNALQTKNAGKTVTAIKKPAKGELPQRVSNRNVEGKASPLKGLWPAWLAGAVIFLLGGVGLLIYRKRLASIRSGIAALEPHVLCVHIDRDVTITGVTEAICKVTGFSKEDLMGQSLHVLGAPAVGGKTKLTRLLDAVAQGQTWQGEAKLTRKDGTEIWTDVLISPSRRKNDRIGYSVIYQDASKRKHYEKLAIRDELTGLYNRRHFNTIVPGLLQEAAAKDLFFGLFLFDVDNFKQYNDTYGHPAGDDVLAAIGKTTKGLLKRNDDLCFRLGGEEFGIIVLFTRHEDAVAVGRKILDSIRSLNISHEHNPPGIVTVSIGVAIAHGTDSPNFDDIYKRADTCLYKAKQTGRNRCVMSRAKSQENITVKTKDSGPRS